MWGFSQTPCLCTLRKLAHAIYRDFFSVAKMEKFTGKQLIFLLFLHKTYIVGTSENRLIEAEAVLTSTHDACFGSKIRQLGIPLQTPILLYKKWGLRGYTFHGHVFLMNTIDS